MHDHVTHRVRGTAGSDVAGEQISSLRIPIAIPALELPAPTVEARDALLSAIAAETQAITAEQASEGAAALETLARAYTMVAAHEITAFAPAANAR